MENQKTILISPPAAEKMKQELNDGASWRVELSTFT